MPKFSGQVSGDWDHGPNDSVHQIPLPLSLQGVALCPGGPVLGFCIISSRMQYERGSEHGATPCAWKVCAQHPCKPSAPSNLSVFARLPPCLNAVLPSWLGSCLGRAAPLTPQTAARRKSAFVQSALRELLEPNGA